MPSPNYLVRRGESYYLRLPIPKAYQTAIGKKEIWKSLGRCSYAEACLAIKRIISDYFRVDMKDISNNLEQMFSKEALKGWLDDYVALNTLDHETCELIKYDVYGLVMTAWLTLDGEEAKVRVRQIEGFLFRAIEELRSEDFSTGRSILNAFLSAAHIQASHTNHEYLELLKDCHTVYMMGAKDAIEQLNKGNSLEPGKIYHTTKSLFHQRCKLVILPKPRDKKPAPVKFKGPTLSQLIDQFNAAPETKRKGISLLEKYDLYQSYLLELLGKDTPIELIVKPYVREHLYVVLEHLPANAAKIAEFKGIGRKQIASKARGRTDLKKLSASSKNDVIEHLSIIFKFAEGEGHNVKDPTQGLRFKDDIAPEDKKLPFAIEQLNVLFSSPELKNAKNSLEIAYNYWIPFLGLATGMRIGELVQLRCKDVKYLGDDFYISINREAGKSTKTTNSVRWFPVYSLMKKAGFLEYVQRAIRAWGVDAPLFTPIVANIANPADAFSKKFKRTMVGLGIDSKQVSLHSLRHNFRDVIRNSQMSDRDEVELLRAAGWKSFRSAVHGGYGTQTQVKRLIEICDKLEFEGLKV